MYNVSVRGFPPSKDVAERTHLMSAFAGFRTCIMDQCVASGKICCQCGHWQRAATITNLAMSASRVPCPMNPSVSPVLLPSGVANIA